MQTITKNKVISLSEKLFPILISLIFLFPVIRENISSLTLILLSVNLIVYKIISKDKTIYYKKILFFTLPFFIILTYSILTNRLFESSVHIKHGLMFLVLPFLFANLPNENFSNENLEKYFTLLKNVCFAIAIVYLTAFFIETPLWKFDIYYYNESTFRNYIYNDFKLFKIHPTYYTTILIFCTVHSLLKLNESKKYFQLVYVFLYLIITFLLLTKLTIILLMLSIIYVLIVKNKENVLKKTLFVLTLLIFLIFILNYIPGVKDRFSEFYISIGVKPKGDAFDSTNIRKSIFDCSINIAKENWLRGVGFEKIQDELNYCYKSNFNSNFHLNHNYMTHNYFIYILISSGIFGLLVLLFYFYNIIRFVLKVNSFLLSNLVITILLLCFIEDFFYRHYGVLYFNLILMSYFQNYLYNKNIN